VKRSLIIGCAATAILSACATHQGRNELSSSSPRAPEIQKSLDQTVIPEIDIESVSLENAVKAWHDASSANHRVHFDFRYAISHPMVFNSTPTATAPPAGSPAKPVRISVRRKNITSGRLLDEICQQAKYKWIIMGRVIVLRPGDAAQTTTQP
jgi:hypothetical protein